MTGFFQSVAEWNRPEFKLFVREQFKVERDLDPHDWDVRLDFYLKQIPRYSTFNNAIIIRSRELIELFKTHPRNIAIAMQKLYQKGAVVPFSQFGDNDNRALLQRLAFWKRALPEELLNDPDTEWVFMGLFRETISRIGQYLRSNYTSRVLTTSELHDLLSLAGLHTFLDSPDAVRLLRAYNDVLIPVFENNNTLMGWVFTL